MVHRTEDRVRAAHAYPGMAIELKTESGRLTPIQVWQIDRLRQLGVNVAVIRGMDEAAEFIEEVRDAIHM